MLMPALDVLTIVVDLALQDINDIQSCHSVESILLQCIATIHIVGNITVTVALSTAAYNLRQKQHGQSW